MSPFETDEDVKFMVSVEGPLSVNNTLFTYCVRHHAFPSGVVLISSLFSLRSDEMMVSLVAGICPEQLHDPELLYPVQFRVCQCGWRTCNEIAVY